MSNTWRERDGVHRSYVYGERANAVLEMVMTDPDMVLIEVAE